MVVPSAPGSRVMIAAARERALVADREPVRRLELGDRDRIGHRDARGSGPSASPSVPTPTGPGVRSADGLHLVHPARLALDVGDDSPRRARSAHR